MNIRLYKLSAIMLLCLLVTACAKEEVNDESVPQIDFEEVTTLSSETVEIPSKPDTTTAASTAPATEPGRRDYVKVVDYIPDVVVELRYATEDNFTGQIIYDFNEAYLRYGTVLLLMEAADELRDMGYRIKIWDAYRPFYAQEKLFEVYPNGAYVANPSYGPGGHNLGGTMDITLTDLEGNEVVMPTGFDDFSVMADRDYTDVESEEAVYNAMILENVMAKHGFSGYSGEWWDYTDTVNSYGYDDFKPEE